MRIKIIASSTDGRCINGKDVKVIDADTGETIPGVYRAKWSCEVGQAARAVLYMNGVEIDATGLCDITELGDSCREYESV